MNNEFLNNYFKKKNKKILKILIFIVSFIVLLIVIQNFFSSSGKFVAKITIENIILDNSDIIKKINKFKDDENLQGVLVSINSPGGTVVSSKELYTIIKRIRKNVPVVVSMKEVAASGGYMVSLAGNKIFSYEGTLTGSIGVILQSANIEEFLKIVGVRPLIFKSGNLKAVPNPLERLDTEGIKNIEDIIKDMHQKFLDLVKTERNISSDNIRLISDGRIFTGAQAKKINLVDYIGNEDDAIEWLKKEAQINGEINLVDFSQEEKISSLFNFSIFKNFINNVSFYPTGLYALWSANYE